MRTKQPYQDCPRRQSCSVNNCPLDPIYPNRYVDTEDQEKKCTLPKSYRLRTAAMHPRVLPLGGLTPREFQGRQAWESLTPEEQVERKKRLKKIGFACVSQDEEENLDTRKGVEVE